MYFAIETEGANGQMCSINYLSYDFAVIFIVGANKLLTANVTLHRYIIV